MAVSIRATCYTEGDDVSETRKLYIVRDYHAPVLPLDRPVAKSAMLRLERYWRFMMAECGVNLVTRVPLLQYQHHRVRDWPSLGSHCFPPLSQEY